MKKITLIIIAVLNLMISPQNASASVAGTSLSDAKSYIDLLGEAYRVSPNQPGVRVGLEDKGFTVFQAQTDPMHAVVLKKGDTVYIIYLGASEQDTTTVLSFNGVTSSFAWGKVHSGFYHGLKQSWDEIYTDIFNYAKSKGKKVTDLNFIIIGHSMGGATAVIAGLRLANVSFDFNPGNHIKVITFGSPRVFDTIMAKQYDCILGEHTVRIVHEGEGPIPSLPPQAAASQHVGKNVVTAKPPEKDGKPLVHVFPAYAKSIKGMQDQDFKALEGQEYTSRYDILGGITSVASYCLTGPIQAAKRQISQAVAGKDPFIETKLGAVEIKPTDPTAEVKGQEAKGDESEGEESDEWVIVDKDNDKGEGKEKK